MAKLTLFAAVDLLWHKKDSCTLTLQSIDAVLSGSFEFTFYIQHTQFICLLSQTGFTHANTVLTGVGVFIVEG